MELNKKIFDIALFARRRLSLLIKGFPFLISLYGIKLPASHATVQPGSFVFFR